MKKFDERLEDVAERVSRFIAYDVGLPIALTYEFLIGNYSFREAIELWKNPEKYLEGFSTD